MKEIEIGFACLPNNFQQTNNFIYNTLSKKYKIVISDQPEYLFYSTFAGAQPISRIRTFFTGENIRPDMHDCDWAFGFDYESDVNNERYMRLPLYVLHTAGLKDFWHEIPQLLKKPQDSSELEYQFAEFQQKKFCVYIAANETMLRSQAFEIISKHGKIAAPGSSKNNTHPIGHKTTLDSRVDPDWQQAKIEYMKNFKFALVFENDSYPGYTTEKLLDAMLAGCIPIYWGNPCIENEFNTASFFNLTPQVDKAISKLPANIRSGSDRFSRKLVHLAKNIGLKQGLKEFLDIKSNPDLLLKKFKQPWIVQQRHDHWYDFCRYENRLFEIVES